MLSNASKCFSPVSAALLLFFLALPMRRPLFATPPEDRDELADVGPVLLMRLNESEGATTFRDSSGNNRDGSCSGGTCPIRGEFGAFGPAMIFDGTDDVIGGIPLGAAGTSDWSMSAWVRTTDTGAGMVITNRATEPERSMSLHVGWFAGAATNNGLAYYSNDGAGCEWGAVGTTNIANGNFHHLVGVREALGTYRIYVNGALEGTTNVTAGTGCQNSSADTTSNWMIGNGPAWVGSQWNGTIALVTVYDYVLTARDVFALHALQRRWLEGTEIESPDALTPFGLLSFIRHGRIR